MAASKKTEEQERTATTAAAVQPTQVEARPHGMGNEHPLAGTLGAFADDPAWEFMLEEIRRLREQGDGLE
jgi:hypothetical protein